MTPANRIAELERYAAEAEARDTAFSRGWAKACRRQAERIREREAKERVRVTG